MTAKKRKMMNRMMTETSRLDRNASVLGNAKKEAGREVNELIRQQREFDRSEELGGDSKLKDTAEAIT